MIRPQMNVHAVILAGGKGTRFWPKSRARRPKQLLPLVSERTMVVETLDRLSPLATPSEAWVVAGSEHAEEIGRQLPRVPREQIVVEPFGRNTAPAIGLAAHLIARRDPGGAMIVLPADHHIRDVARFHETLDRALAIAANDEVLVTIGIEPTAPETGYGYIERGTPLGGGAYRVARFTEKPDLRRAEEFLLSKSFLWNSGIFVWRVDAIRLAIARHLPETDRVLTEIAAAWGPLATFSEAWSRIADESIDYGVLEKASNVAVVPGDFGWDDIGSWIALERLREPDASGNTTRGRVLAIESRGNVVAAEERLVALVGVENLVVVETADAILVCARDKAQDIRKVVAEIERRKWNEFL